MITEDVLKSSFDAVTRFGGRKISRLEFLSAHVFNFTTYDSRFDELFSLKALEVCAAISGGQTFKYIENPDNYHWFLVMVNMPFFCNRLEWGTSVRGAWWEYGSQTLESTGIWIDGKQVTSFIFSREEWLLFIAALGEFAANKPCEAG